jgi:hypothetical protein
MQFVMELSCSSSSANVLEILDRAKRQGLRGTQSREVPTGDELSKMHAVLAARNGGVLPELDHGLAGLLAEQAESLLGVQKDALVPSGGNVAVGQHGGGVRFAVPA